MCTATAKDSPLWRTERDIKLASPDWQIERLQYFEAPFVWAEHWERMQRNMSPREWQRRGLALDVRPERALYYGFDRKKQLRPIPVGAKDVTREVLQSGRRRLNLEMLVGYDPGSVKHVATYLKAFRFLGRPEVDWFVVGELIRENVDTEAFALDLRNDLRSRFRVQYAAIEDPKAFVVSDKYVDTEKSEKRDRSVYTAMRNAGFDIRPAAYEKNPPKGKAPGPGSVPVEAAVEMINRLCGNALGETRLWFLSDDDGIPAAPELVQCLESSERGADGSAESHAKRDKRTDLSDLPASLRLALWPFERIRRDLSTESLEAVG